MRSKLALSLAAAALAVALAACSAATGPGGTEGTALQSHPYMRLTGQAPTGRIVNLADVLYNHDGAPIRVLSVRLISPSGPGIHATIRALAPSLDNGGTFLGFQGDLAKCPESFGFRVLPVTRIVEPPHGESDWRYLLSLVFTRPGTYHLYVLKVAYVEGGQRYWNYVRADITIRAKADPSLITPPCG